MVGCMGGAGGAGGSRQHCEVTCWSPSIFLPFVPPRSLSQGLTEDLHPKQGYPAWLEETQLSSAPGHSTIIAACKHSCSPDGSGRDYFLLGTNRK